MEVDQASWLSFFTYGWLSSYMELAYKYGLKSKDLPPCSPNDRCEFAVKRMECMWKEEVQQKGLKKASLMSVVWKFIRARILLFIFLYLVSLGLGFLGPIVFMRRLLEFCEDKNALWWHGAIWALGLVCSDLVRVIFYGMTWGAAYRTGIRLRSGLITMLYKKTTRLSTLGDKSIGKMINIFTNDSQRIFDFIAFGPIVVGGPFVASIGIGYILWTMGPSGLFGILAFLFFFPTQYAISSLTAHLRQKTVRYTDQRVRLINEILTSIKVIKMYAWEKPFLKAVRDIRNKEHFLLQTQAYVQSFIGELIDILPKIAVVITFITYKGFGNSLSSADAFIVWCIMDNISIPTFDLPFSITTLLEMKLVVGRIKSILCLDEIKNYSDKTLDLNVVLAISNASFFWPSIGTTDKKKKKPLRRYDRTVTHKDDVQLFSGVKSKACLNDINFVVSKGRLIGICGSVASGKTSLFSAILGQMELDQGKISVDGSFAYVQQQAWITNCSLQDNILFGEPFDEKRYSKVVWASALVPDFNILPAGDQTEIGERGINLSGGQRQRVAIARALYADKEIYLLDDPLSAVDGHVAKHIFEHCFLDLLKNKTVLLVTHHLQFLSRCDEVVFMDKGRIVDQANHTALMIRNEQYSNLIKTFVQNGEEKVEDESEDNVQASNFGDSFSTSLKNNMDVPPFTTDPKSSNIGNLIDEENVEIGSVPLRTYLVYLKYSGGYCFALIFCGIFFINTISSVFSSWWLAHWINDGLMSPTKQNGNDTQSFVNLKLNLESNYYGTVCGICFLVMFLSCLFRSFFFTKGSLRASSQIHNHLFQKIFTSPMRFFDSTPVGRLLNLFSRDVDEIDCRLSLSLGHFLQYLIFVIVTVILIVLVFPWFLVALILLTVIAYNIFLKFRCAFRDLQRIESTSHSPVYSHVAETINGLGTILAFGKEREFISKFMSLFDKNTTSFFLSNCSIRWLSVRLDILSVSIVGITAGLVVAFHGTIPAAFAGLALVYSGQCTSLLQYVVRMIVNTESSFMSVQRLNNYITTMESEIPDNTENVYKPPKDWPRMGAIRFNNVQMRYQSHFPFVIQNISFKVQPKEKIGIVGRTGSGKSSLGVCLFRLVELTSGFIEIDGIDIARIGLEDLRSKLSIIPQDPVLFIGTVRYNLDPFQKHSDHEIWRALERTCMKIKVKTLSGKLESLVIENGENFSVGERQLLCMARALLRQSKILVLDEATAAIDSQTDTLLQGVLREAFNDCTVLTIAHRLNTVVSSDRILVLHDGKVVEFDRPSILLTKMSEFSKMMASTN